MKVELRDSKQERRVLIGMVTDKRVLQRIATRWEKNFKSKWANIVGEWCVKHYRKFEDAPGKAIETIYEEWAKGKETDATKLIAKFLGEISSEYEALKEESNPNYLVDLAGIQFNRNQIQKSIDEAQEFLEANDIEKAVSVFTSYRKIELGTSTGIDAINDLDAVQAAFEVFEEPPLVAYNGALREFFGRAFSRYNFVAFEGPMKRGKSWLLLDVAWRAMLNRRKVAFFAAGDMTQQQVMQRLMIRAARLPLYKQTVKIPKSIEVEDDKLDVDFDETELEALSWRKAWKACQKIRESKVRSTKTMLKIAAYANGELGMDTIYSVLDTWEADDWVPDVIVIDYADLLKAPNRTYREDKLEAIDQNWKELRGLSSKHHLVVTATQSSAGSFTADTLGMQHFSGNKLKMAHVTGMIGINQTRVEKKNGVYRFNWIVRREEDSDESRCVYSAGCLAIGNPTIRSCFQTIDGDE